MKINHKKVSMLVVILVLLVFSNLAFATTIEDSDTQKLNKEITTFMNSNMNVLRTENINVPIKSSLELSNGEVVEITVLLEDITEEDGMIKPSSSETVPMQPGRSYTVRWTAERTGFLGGKITSSVHLRTSLNPASDIRLFLTGTGTDVNGTPPQGYKIESKDSYFTTNTEEYIIKADANIVWGLMGVQMNSGTTTEVWGGIDELIMYYDIWGDWGFN